MSCKPIIFSTPMVQAILAGKKTQTRRVIKPQPDCPYVGTDHWHDSPRGSDTLGPIRRIPYAPGDVLWVRETWKPDDYQLIDGFWSCAIVYKAGGVNGRVHWPEGLDSIYDLCLVWHSPVAMPRDASRLFLRVKKVRAERVQDISTSDCEGEGIASDIDRFNGLMTPHHDWIVGEFARIWDARNAKRGYGWDSNPWTWVIEFERIEKGAELWVTSSRPWVGKAVRNDA